MNNSAGKQYALDITLSELESEGFDVFRGPIQPAQLPEFMHDFRPDAVAVSPSRKIAIKVVTDSPSDVDQAQKLFEAQENWELRVVYAHQSGSRERLSSPAPPVIEQSLRNIERLRSSSEVQSALLLAWATFEAIGRALKPESFVRPQTPGRLVEVLSGSGFVTPGEATLLRTLAEQRNRLIHGDLTVDIDPESITAFSGILSVLLGFLKKAA